MRETTYTCQLNRQHRQLQQNSGDANKEIRAKIDRTISSSYTLRSKKDLIEQFINSVNNTTNIELHWRDFINERKALELKKIIEEENLNSKETLDFIERSFSDGELQVVGTAITKLLPAKNMFSPTYEHGIHKSLVIMKLRAFFERFLNL